ncbi:MAG: toll/interleukin-1 receptor domain-containing protein [Ktedonobacterales bacterium]
MNQQMMVFVSHAHEDDTFCRAVVEGLRGAGADVWYDEHNLGSGQLMEVIQRELGRRPIVVVILSKAAFASSWVRREVAWAYELIDRDPTRLIVPVTASPIERGDFNPAQGWLFLHDFKRIEAPGMQPYPVQEAVHRLLRDLALMPIDEGQGLTTTQTTESTDELINRGKALSSWRVDLAIDYFVRATQLAPNSFDAWVNLGRDYARLERWQESLTALDRALALKDDEAFVWYSKGATLQGLQRYEEALTAYDRTLALDERDAPVWRAKSTVFDGQPISFGSEGYEEARAARDHISALSARAAAAWSAKGAVFNQLGRYEEALDAYDHALTNGPSYALVSAIWLGKGDALNGLQRHEEALSELNRVLNRGSTAGRLRSRATALRGLGRTTQAETDERRAKYLGG